MYVCTYVLMYQTTPLHISYSGPLWWGEGILYLWLMSEFPVDVVECKRRPLLHNLVSRCVDAQVSCVVLDLSPWPHLYHGWEGSGDSVGLGSLEGRRGEGGGEGKG